MRFLTYRDDGELTITANLDNENTIPPYAILSHTWGADAEEVSFEDIASNAGRAKLGYEKIRFCGAQAQEDGLRHFWVDTCCIDQTNKANLCMSIKSMFSYYRNAARCYVYLSDVFSPSFATGEEVDTLWWEADLRKSRWFTRGWTLQELLAPSSVEFFSRDGVKLGDRLSLLQEIHEVTGIPRSALQGSLLSNFSVEERISWSESRTTKLPVDRAYSLMGILGVSISPFDGESQVEAFKRITDEIKKQNKCIQDLRLTDPRYDKVRIEATKGGLLKDSYNWVLGNASFLQWQYDLQCQLLWVKGHPGKGKTMLLCGIIDELPKMTPKSALISYFFCQATDLHTNSATAVLRGLLYLLVSQQPLLISHIRKRYDYAGKTLFEGANAWYSLTEILMNMLQDSSLSSCYLIIDALDECVTNLPMLLDLIVKQSSASSRVKWIVSSRNWPDIEERLKRASHKVSLSLELNAESVSAAVNIFIERKVLWLAQEKRYNHQMKVAVIDHLVSNANDTFLWVALVCQSLEATSNRHVLKKLESFPPGLDHLYQRMIRQISKSDDANVCKNILASMALVYRPITLTELAALIEQLENTTDNLESMREIIGLCGSFLTLRDETIYFVHQSAKDFLLTKATEAVFPLETKDIHHTIFARSLFIMPRTLRRDVYGLKALGCSVDSIELPDPDPLATSRYSCIYWVDHMHDSYSRSSASLEEYLRGRDAAYIFMKANFLYWLEALSLCKSMSKGVESMAKLWSLVQERGDTSQFSRLVHDAYRFTMYHKRAIESSPLQTYMSALLFSPTDSLVRKLFQHEEPEWIAVKPDIGDGWSACLQTLEGHSSWVSSVAFSHNSALLASASGDRTIKIWDAGSGACLRTLRGHRRDVRSVAFSHNSTQIASASEDRTAKIWSVDSGECLRTLRGHRSYIRSVTFSHNSTWLASASGDWTVKIWNVGSGECLYTLKGHRDWISSVAFSHDSTRLASGSGDKTIKIWDAGSGVCLYTLKGHRDWINSIAFSHDSIQLASASEDMTIKIWEAGSGAYLYTLNGHRDWIYSVAFSHNSTKLASASRDRTIKIWDVSSRTCLQTLQGHSDSVSAIAFSHNSTRLASTSEDRTVKIWDLGVRDCHKMLESHNDWVCCLTFSSNSTKLASASKDRTVRIWDVGSGSCLQILRGHSDSVTAIAFSHNSTKLASASRDGAIKIWDMSSGACLKMLRTGRVVLKLSFDLTESYLFTDIGTFSVSTLEVSSMIEFVETKHLRYLGAGIDFGRTWITCSGQNVLWLPSEYRPSCESSCGSTVGIGTGFGRVWICSISL